MNSLSIQVLVLEKLSPMSFFLFGLAIGVFDLTLNFWETNFHQILIHWELVLELWNCFLQLFSQIYHVKISFIFGSVGPNNKIMAEIIVMDLTRLIIVDHSWFASLIDNIVYLFLTEVLFQDIGIEVFIF